MSQLSRILDVSREHFGVSVEPTLQWRLARTSLEIAAAQRLRHEVFSQEMTAQQWSNESIDADRFDEHCQHLVVLDLVTDRVVGTYRILTSDAAVRAGGFYSEQGFELGTIAQNRRQYIELGRSCVHPDYRDGAVVRLLLKGLATVIANRAEQYIIGCPSVSAADGGYWGAAVYKKLAARAKASERYQVTPRNPLSADLFQYNLDPVIPPLIKGYVKMGAKIVGEPHHDVSFGSIDFFMVMPAILLTSRLPAPLPTVTLVASKNSLVHPTAFQLQSPSKSNPSIAPALPSRACPESFQHVH